jgi:hypothetical protein
LPPSSSISKNRKKRRRNNIMAEMKYKELSMDLIGTCVNKLLDAHLTKPEFLDCMCEIYMRTILGYCKAEHLDPLETLTLFHQKCEEISLKGHDEAKRELETKRLA